MALVSATLIAFFLVVLAGTSIVVYSIKTGVAPVPSSKKARDKILDLIPDDVVGDIVDLGSGWGSLVFPIAAEFPSCSVVGYEQSPVPLLFSWARSVFSPRDNLEIRRQDFFDVPLNNARVIVCYLYQDSMKRLKTKFEAELRPGTMVISKDFRVPRWTPQQTHAVNDIMGTVIYVYSV